MRSFYLVRSALSGPSDSTFSADLAARACRTWGNTKAKKSEALNLRDTRHDKSGGRVTREEESE